MDRVYVVGFEDNCLIAFKERADAEEYIFTIAEENLYEDYLPDDYNREDVITYHWHQNRNDNLQGQFNFYYSVTKNSVSRGSMFVYMLLLFIIGIAGDLLATLIEVLIAKFM